MNENRRNATSKKLRMKWWFAKKRKKARKILPARPLGKHYELKFPVQCITKIMVAN